MRSSSWNSATKDGTSSTVACRPRTLPPLEPRFALLEEGAHALLLVPGGEQRDERLALDPQPLLERGIGGRPPPLVAAGEQRDDPPALDPRPLLERVIGGRHRPLGRGVGEQGPGGERSGLVDGDAIDLAGRRQPVDEPAPAR